MGRFSPFSHILTRHLTPSTSSVTSEYLITHAIPLLASHLLATLPDLKSIDRVWGPAELLRAFNQTWLNMVNEHSGERKVRVELDEKEFLSTMTYATKHSVLSLPPPPLSSSSQDLMVNVTLAESNEATVDTLAPLFLAFTAIWPGVHLTLDDARKYMCEGVKKQTVWVARTPSSDSAEIVGFVMLGRLTPHTVALKHVFTSPSYRRRGIAEQMLSVVMRGYLGIDSPSHSSATTTTTSSPSENNLPGGIKTQICLNVSDVGAQRLYKRCGFLLGAGVVDVETGLHGSEELNSSDIGYVDVDVEESV